MYVATINQPGYLPDAEPQEFESADDAWLYLYEERARFELDTEGYADLPAFTSGTTALRLLGEGQPEGLIGLIGDTPDVEYGCLLSLDPKLGTGEVRLETRLDGGGIPDIYSVTYVKD